MKSLSRKSLSELREGIQKPNYSPDSITPGILHFGSGNFHRAHQAVYCDALLNTGETQWGITGVSLRSSGVRNKLAPQDYLYTQATLGESTSYRVISSICSLIVAPENPIAVVQAIAKNSTQLITTTITEKGYYLSDGQINLADQAIKADIESLDEPQTNSGP